MSAGQPVPSGVGIDIVDVAEVVETLAEHGERYLTRVYTPVEIAAWGRSGARLALCFAAKEAALKALAPDDEAVAWHSVEVRPVADGAVLVDLGGGAAALASKRGVGRLVGATALARGQATAVVVACR